MEALKQHIIDQVVQHWQEKKQILLLAQLGARLNREGLNLGEALGGRKLASFIEDELASNLSIMRLQAAPLTVGVVPRAVAEGEGIPGYFASRRYEGSQPVEIPRIQPAFWAAFLKPLLPGMARKIELEPKIHWQDVPADTPDLATGKVIGEEFMVNDKSLSPHEVSVQVFKSIENWLNVNSLTLDAVQEKRDNQGAIDANIKAGGNNLMARIISALSQEQLQRTQLPLDVVSKLLKSF